MKKYILLFLFIIATDFALAQVSSPSSYTTNYRIRKYAQGANPSADSLNANSDLIDTKIKMVYDSTQAKVNTYATQTIIGAKTFSNTVTTSGDLIITREAINITTTSFSVSGITFGILQPDAAYDVVTINGGAGGKIVYLVNSAADAVTLKDNSGNLVLAGDFAMGQWDSVVLIYDGTSSKWVELSRTNN